MFATKAIESATAHQAPHPARVPAGDGDGLRARGEYPTRSGAWNASVRAADHVRAVNGCLRGGRRGAVCWDG
ncbi:hypothetical protein GCM10010466_50460 [Planomonospora alba]|uniref:Uncharacterized protein n=1 Tax=Planomonospora alba TaxID=161354 RepID=A0ABP6NNQ0_9ACTN